MVVLVDVHDVPIGTMEKDVVHTAHTPLHRGFSVFIFNDRGEVLLQRRSSFKQTWPLMWSNSCCGHPLPNESYEDAVRRRLSHELGINEVHHLELALPEFRYRAEREGIVENEICPVWVGYIQREPTINPHEVAEYRWADWRLFCAEITEYPERYSAWCGWEVAALLQAEQKGLIKLS